MNIVSTEKIREEIELVQHARDFFRSLRCARKGTRIGICILAGREEMNYQRRLEALNAELAKLPKPALS